MSNMSYCAFENTYGDLRDCMDLIEEDGGSIENYEAEANEYEQPYIRGLLRLCKEFVETYEFFLED